MALVICAATVAGCGSGSSDSPPTTGHKERTPAPSASSAPAPAKSAGSGRTDDRSRAVATNSSGDGRVLGGHAKTKPNAQPNRGARVLPAHSPAARRYLQKLTQGVATGGGPAGKRLKEILARAKRGEFGGEPSGAGSVTGYAEEALRKIAEGKIGQ